MTCSFVADSLTGGVLDDRLTVTGRVLAVWVVCERVAAVAVAQLSS